MGRGTLESAAKVIPAEHAFRIVPNDGVDLIAKTRGLYVGVAGNVRVQMVDGGVETFENMTAGVVHPLCAIRVFATGTSATGIRGLR